MTPFVIAFSKYIKFFDYPSERKIHKKPTPLSGGLIILTVTVIFSKILIKDSFVDAILLYGALIFMLGLIDDYVNLNPFLKLSGQIIIVLFFLTNIDKVYLVSFFGNYFINLFVTLVWMLFIINAINLIDGVDGLAAGLSFILFTSVASISLQNHYNCLLTYSLIFASSLIIFLRFNISPAKVFLGDSGSLYLGFVISSVSLYVNSKSLISSSFFIPVMFLLIPLLDVVRVVLKRFQKRTNIFKADKEHIHHKLLDYGFSDRQVLLLLYSITCFISVMTIKNYIDNFKQIVIFVLMGVFLLFVLIKIFQIFNFRKFVRIINFKSRRYVRRLIKGSYRQNKIGKVLIACNVATILILLFFYGYYILHETWNIEKSIAFIIIGVIILTNQLFLSVDDTTKIFSNFSIFWVYFYIAYILNIENPQLLNLISLLLLIIVCYKTIIKHQFDLFIYNPMEILIVHTIAVLLFSIKGLNIALLFKIFIIYYSSKQFFDKESREYKIFIPLTSIMIIIYPIYNLLFYMKGLK